MTVAQRMRIDRKRTKSLRSNFGTRRKKKWQPQNSLLFHFRKPYCLLTSIEDSLDNACLNDMRQFHKGRESTLNELKVFEATLVLVVHVLVTYLLSCKPLLSCSCCCLIGEESIVVYFKLLPLCLLSFQ